MAIVRTKKWGLWAAALCGLNGGLIVGMYRWGFLGEVYDAVPALGRLMLWGVIGALVAAAVALVRNRLVAAVESGSIALPRRAPRAGPRRRWRSLLTPWRRRRAHADDAADRPHSA